MKIVQRLGVRRVGLLLLALAALLLRPAAGGTPVYEGWPFVTTLLVPALVPLVFLGLLLDMLMTWVMSVDLQPDQRARPRSVLWADFAMATAVGLVWIPFFLSLGN